MLKLSDFDYQLPKELIAQYPLLKRDSARLLVIERARKAIEHRHFSDIQEYLKPHDLLVLNDTKVLPSRILGQRKTGAKVEVLLLKLVEGTTFKALIRPARVKIGEEIKFNGPDLSGIMLAKDEIRFSCSKSAQVYRHGRMPLPPYIKRDVEDQDKDYYQTVYAKNEGAVAAPTAGLHFTGSLLEQIKNKGLSLAYITLHVGFGTFHPVKCEHILEHKMEFEDFMINKAAGELINQARKRKSRIFSVGTTTCRALEAYAAGIHEGKTDLFIYPGYNFKLVNCLLTNFHLPRTTLFMLVCAFAGSDLIKRAYAEAIERKYRFYSYGDAMLII